MFTPNPPGLYYMYLAYVNSIDGSDVAMVKVPALSGQTVIVVQPSLATGWTAPVVGEQRFVGVSADFSDVRWVV